MIGIVNYGMGNLRSVQKALERVGAAARILDHPEEIAAVKKLVLPGVGAFGDASDSVHRGGWAEPLLEHLRGDRPFLGICLGLQLLFDGSAEAEGKPGLGFLSGRCERFAPSGLKVPHMGWNQVDFAGGENPLLSGVDSGAFAYFVHSYYPAPAEPSVVATTTDYGEPFCSSVRLGRVFATQFHPEKSQRVGLRILQNFAAM